MFPTDMFFERHRPIIEFRPLQSTNEACILQHVLLLLFLRPQITERVDDNTKDEVEYDDDEHDVECHIVHRTPQEQILLQLLFLHFSGTLPINQFGTLPKTYAWISFPKNVSDASILQSPIDGSQNAHPQSVASEYPLIPSIALDVPVTKFSLFARASRQLLHVQEEVVSKQEISNDREVIYEN